MGPSVPPPAAPALGRRFPVVPLHPPAAAYTKPATPDPGGAMTLRHALAAPLLLALAAAAAADPKRDALWAAVRGGDVKAVRAAVAAGADVNARNEYGITALWIAVGKGNPEVVEFLVT